MNLYLIGFRGSGKSMVAPHVAAALDWMHVDTDQQVEILTERTIAQIFDEEGEAGFRQWETTVLQAFSLKSEQVISLGGGATTVAENRDIIRRTGRTVWLTTSPYVLWQRIQADRNSPHQRPRLTPMPGLDEIQYLLRQRTDDYIACADYTIDTTQLTPEQIADQIANWFDPVDT